MSFNVFSTALLLGLRGLYLFIRLSSRIVFTSKIRLCSITIRSFSMRMVASQHIRIDEFFDRMLITILFKNLLPFEIVSYSFIATCLSLASFSFPFVIVSYSFIATCLFLISCSFPFAIVSYSFIATYLLHVSCSFPFVTVSYSFVATCLLLALCS